MLVSLCKNSQYVKNAWLQSGIVICSCRVFENEKLIANTLNNFFADITIFTYSLFTVDKFTAKNRCNTIYL